MRAREAEVGAAGAPEPLRRPLADDVREEEQPVAAGRRLRRGVEHRLGRPEIRRDRLAAATRARCRRRSSPRPRPSGRARGRSRTSARRDRPTARRPRRARRRSSRSSRRRRPAGSRRARGWRAGPSAPPTTTGVPAGRPTSAVRGTAWVPSTRRARRSADSPASARASSSQSSVCRLRSPVPEAVPWSTSSSPVSACSTSSLTPAHHRTDANVSGSRSRHHTSFASGDIGCIGVPVRRASAGSRRRSACSAARSSAQVSSGVTGAASASSPTRLCIAPHSASPGDGAAGRRDRLADRVERPGDDRLRLRRRRRTPLAEHRPVGAPRRAPWCPSCRRRRR